MWTTKHGHHAEPMPLALTLSGEAVDFADLAGPGGSGVPQLRMRLRARPDGTVTAFGVEAYSGGSDDYNAQVTFPGAALDALDVGVYIAEVDAHIDGADVTFPREDYFLVRVQAGLA